MEKTEIEPIKETPVKNLAHLEKIIEANWNLGRLPIFRHNNKDDELLCCYRQEIKDDWDDGYVFYSPNEAAAYGDWEYYIKSNPDDVGEIDEEEIDPDDLVYTGQIFITSETKLEVEAENIHDFSVSVDGNEINYHTFQASMELLTKSDQVVLGAWYFEPDDTDCSVFSAGYKTLEDAKIAAENFEILKHQE